MSNSNQNDQQRQTDTTTTEPDRPLERRPGDVWDRGVGMWVRPKR